MLRCSRCLNFWRRSEAESWKLCLDIQEIPASNGRTGSDKNKCLPHRERRWYTTTLAGRPCYLLTMKRLIVIFCSLAVALAVYLPVAKGELKPGTLAKPIKVRLALAARSQVVVGELQRYDTTKLYVKTEEGLRSVLWTQLTARSQFDVRSEIINKKSASDWLDLAEVALGFGMRDEVKAAVSSAIRCDPASKLKGDALVRRAATQPSSYAKYQKSTAAQNAKAIETAQSVAKGEGEKMGIKFVEFQTPHFIVFTDWDAKEFDFLKTNCENAYSAVSRQFAIPVTENVFVGKLPVFMFAKQSAFQKYAATMDQFPAPAGVLGYFTGHGDGTGHMVMWKPDTRRFPNIREAEQRWAFVLTHEFTHAFVSRYRTNRNIPRWVNEGLAEVIAHGEFPGPDAHDFARQMAGTPFEFESLFDDSMMPGASMYPVMQTMVEALIGENRKQFIQMIDDLKDGVEPEAALKKNFKAGYKDWEPAWRKYAKNLRN